MAFAYRSLIFDLTRAEVLAAGQVVPDSSRCVQCGICSYNCPVGLDVRAYAWRDEPIRDARCLTCGECALRCPRGVLRFTTTTISSQANERKAANNAK